jgi:predicted flap endonuclease-1-like 5' DNA nuclease
MIELDPLTIIYIAGAAALGGIIGWFFRSRQSALDLSRLGDDWKHQHDKAVADNDKLSSEIGKLKASLDAAKKIVEKNIFATNQAKTEIASLREKQNALQKNLFVVGAERDELKGRLSSHDNVMNSSKQRVTLLQAEVDKNQEIYKARLAATAEERKILQRKIDDAKAEQESLNKLLTSARAEYQSASNMLAAAQTRLENMDVMENKVISLEADNAQLKHDIALANQGAETLRRELTEFNALKEQNRELVQCLKSMEDRCKQYEEDARRYRNQAEQSEKESDTLRFKIGDIEKNFHEMQSERKDNETEKKSGNGKAETAVKSTPVFGMPKPSGETDDLTEIVGIGKVFERTLHDMGIWYFRQIAAFGPAEIARINSELKEFKGRIEHDDWIGQAKELHYKKYGDKE